MGLGLGNIIWIGIGGGATEQTGEVHEFDMEFSRGLCAVAEITRDHEADVEITRSNNQNAEITRFFDEDPEIGIGVNKPTDG